MYLKKRNIFVGIIICVLILSNVSISCQGGWNQYGADSSHTSSVEGPQLYIQDDEKVIWKHRMEDDLDCTPAIIEKSMVIGDDNGRVFLINTSINPDNRVLDKYKLNDTVKYTVSHGVENIFITTDSRLFAFNITSEGELNRLWYFKPDKGDITCSPVLADDKIILCSSYYDDEKGREIGKMIVLSKRKGVVNGDPYWTERFNSSMENTPVVKDKKVYIGTSGFNKTSGHYHGRVLSLDLEDGSVIWESRFDEEISTSPTLSQNTLFLSNSDHTVLALRKNDGDLKWTFDGKGVVSTTYGLYEDNLYFTTEQGLYSLDVKGSNPELKWKYDDFEQELKTPPSIIGDMLLLGTPSYHLYAFEATPVEDGVDEGFTDPVGKSYDLFWKLELEGEIITQVVAKSGRTYFGTENGYVYSVGDNPPSAEIDVSDTSPQPGESIEFTAEVEDEGQITEYKWFCEEKGTLSDQQNFTTTLEKGEYEVKFKVKDENGYWSQVESETVNVEEEEEGFDFPLLWLALIAVVITAVAGIAGYYFYSGKRTEERPQEDEESLDFDDDFKY